MGSCLTPCSSGARKRRPANLATSSFYRHPRLRCIHRCNRPRSRYIHRCLTSCCQKRSRSSDTTDFLLCWMRCDFTECSVPRAASLLVRFSQRSVSTAGGSSHADRKCKSRTDFSLTGAVDSAHGMLLKEGNWDVFYVVLRAETAFPPDKSAHV